MADDRQPFLVQAIYSFQGKNNDELCFKKGDIITVTQLEEGGWWEGTLGEFTGWFPSNYVKEYKTQDTLSPAKVPPVDLVAQQKVYRSVVIKDIVDSEKANVEELQGLAKNFLHPLDKADIMTHDEWSQLVGNLVEVVSVHEGLLAGLKEMEGRGGGGEQRVGRLFLNMAPRLKAVHQAYCAGHPRAVTILERYKDELSSVMEAEGAASPGLLVLTTGLSKPFRRVDKYAAMLTELERHLDEAHPDRGDTQRAVTVYKEIASACSIMRRQKELELEIVSGGVRGWEGEALSSLGPVLHMGSVAVGADHTDRYLVLFPATLLVLSVSHRMSAFIYEGKLPLTGISINKLEDTDAYKNAFEVVGPMIERIVAVCQTREDQQKWVDLIRQQIRIVGVSAPIPSSHSTMTATNNMVSNASTNDPAWTISCLRPSPPSRPASIREDKQGRSSRKTSERSFEEDAQILRVIEAYCTSAKTRYTVNSALMDTPQVLIAEEEKMIVEETRGDSIVVEEKSLVDTVYALKDEMKLLQSKINAISLALEDEQRSRGQLQNIVHSLLVTVGQSDL